MNKNIGMNGIKTDKESGYKVPSIPDKDMSGYQLIAYYYVSWAIAKPNILPQLGLNMFKPSMKEPATSTTRKMGTYYLDNMFLT